MECNTELGFGRGTSVKCVDCRIFQDNVCNVKEIVLSLEFTCRGRLSSAVGLPRASCPGKMRQKLTVKSKTKAGALSIHQDPGLVLLWMTAESQNAVRVVLIHCT